MNSGREPKRLYRSRQNKMIGGVCAGIAEYFDIDPSWVRIIFVVLFFLGVGIVGIIYIVMWVVVPLAPTGPSTMIQK